MGKTYFVEILQNLLIRLLPSRNGRSLLIPIIILLIILIVILLVIFFIFVVIRSYWERSTRVTGFGFVLRK